MSISNYAELKILDHTTGTASWTAPSGVYLKLHTGDPGEAGTSNARVARMQLQVNTRRCIRATLARLGRATPLPKQLVRL